MTNILFSVCKNISTAVDISGQRAANKRTIKYVYDFSELCVRTSSKLSEFTEKNHQAKILVNSIGKMKECSRITILCYLVPTLWFILVLSVVEKKNHFLSNFVAHNWKLITWNRLFLSSRSMNTRNFESCRVLFNGEFPYSAAVLRRYASLRVKR